MKVKVMKVELMALDTGDGSNEDMKQRIECLSDLYPTVVSIESVEVDWDDDHPLNKEETFKDAYCKMFRLDLMGE